MADRISGPSTVVAALALAALPAAWLSLTAQAPAAALTLSVASGRADMVTGGDALVRIAGGRGTWNQDAFTVNGKAATVKQFHSRRPGGSRRSSRAFRSERARSKREAEKRGRASS